MQTEIVDKGAHELCHDCWKRLKFDYENSNTNGSCFSRIRMRDQAFQALRWICQWNLSVFIQMNYI